MEDLGPFSLAHTQSHDFVAKSNGQTYRVWVATPGQPVPGRPWPVLYSLDANSSFGTVVETARMLGFSGMIPPVLLVGIGYPGSVQEAMVRRSYELTPSSDEDFIKRSSAMNQPIAPAGLGGAAGFLQFITDELAALMTETYNADPTDRALAGFSFGGLFAAYALLQEPPRFERFIIGSPSFWWDRGMMFEVERRRAEGSKSLPARVFISAGEEEQVPGGDLPSWSRMVSNALDFAGRLAERKYEGLELEHRTIPGAGHQFTPMLVSALRSIYRGHPGIQRPPTPD